jgi:hypothetical protein
MFAEAGWFAQQVFLILFAIGSVIGLVSVGVVYRPGLSARFLAGAVLGGIGFVLGSVLAGWLNHRFDYFSAVLNVALASMVSFAAALLAGVTRPEHQKQPNVGRQMRQP